MKIINFLTATFFGIGKIPGAPGTWASIVAMFLFYHLVNQPFHLGAILAVVFFVGVYASGRLEKEMKEKDPSCAVIDEVLGMGVAMLAIPAVWYYVLMAFIFFRLFDIWKPFPIRKLEKLPGGWGIMTDDLLAGIYANVWIRIGAYLVKFMSL